MKKYIVTIEETVCENFEIEAETAEEAKRLAIEKYNSGEFVLEPGELECTRIKLEDESAWEEI